MSRTTRHTSTNRAVVASGNDVLDLEELAARLRAGGVAALVPGWRDLRVTAAGGRPPEVERLCGALLLGAQALDRDPGQLASQLVGRLSAAGAPGLRRLLEQARGWTRGIWLRPAGPSLTAPGGTLVTTATIVEPHATAVALTPAGRVLTGAADGTIRWREGFASEEFATLRAHRRAVTALAVTPDGQTVVSGSADCTVRRWGLVKGEVETLGRLDDWVTAVAVTPDGQRVLAGAADGRLRGWDLRELRTLPMHERHADGVRALALTPDGHAAVSGAEDGTLVGWRIDRPDDAVELAHDDRWITSIAILPGGRLLTGHADGGISLLAEDARTVLTTVTGHLDAVDAIIADPEGRLALSASVGHTIRVWDLGGRPSRQPGPVSVAAVTGSGIGLTIDQRTRRPVVHGPGSARQLSWGPGAVHGDPQAVAISQDGRLALAGTHDSTIAVWAPGDGRDPALLVGHADAVTAVAVTPDGRWAVSGSSDRTIRLWDLRRTVEVTGLLGHARPVTAVAITPESDGRLVAYGTADGTIWQWEPGRAVPPRAHRSPAGQPTAVDLAVTDDADGAVGVVGGPVVVSGWQEGTVRLWHVATDRSETVGHHEGAVTAVAVAPGGRLAVSTGTDRTVRVWDLTRSAPDRPRELACFTADWPVLACAFSERGAGRHAVVACDAAGVLHTLEVVGA